MWIAELDVRGFGRLNSKWTLAAGLTVVTGPNEAGKSTLHEVLVRTLFGFTKSERRKRPDQGGSVKDSFQPWSGAPYGVNARLEEVRGRALIVEWNFASHEVTLRDANTGADLSLSVRGKRDEVTLGHELLGISLEDFRQVCCLHQDAVEAVRHSEELGLALRRSVESGSQDVGVESADELLADYLRTRLGVQTRHYGATRGGRLDEATRELDDVSARLSESEQARENLAALAVELEELRTERDLAADYLERVRQRLHRSRVASLEERLSQAAVLREAAKRRPERPVHLPSEPKDVITAQLARRDAMRTELADLKAQADASHHEVAQFQHERSGLLPEIDSLSAYAEVDTAAEQTVRSARADLEAASVDTGTEAVEVPARDPALDRYRKDRSRLQSVAADSRRVVWRPAWVAGAVAVAVAAVAAGVLLHPAAFAGAVLAGVLLAAARTVDSGSSLAEALSAYGAATLEELDARAAKEDQRVSRAEAVVAERERQRAERKAAREKTAETLRSALDGVGTPPREDVLERSKAYLVACDKQRRLVQLQGKLGTLEARIASAAQPERDLGQRRRDLMALEDELRAGLDQLGIEATDVDAARERFDGLIRQATADARQVSHADQAQARLEGLLGDESDDQLGRRLEEAEQELREHVARHGALVADEGDVDALARQVEGQEQKVRALELNVRERAARLEEQESQLEDPAVLRERATALEQEIARMEQVRDAIRIARESLAEAAREAHQEFAPHLNAALRDNLARITGGRYEEATVDEELQIRVRAPETGKFLPLEALSRGTRDQIFLVERLEIAKLLDPTTGEAPLLLDGPFARFDDTRVRYGLEVLGQVAAERQVFMFTEDSRLVRLAEELCPGCSVIELPGPAVADEVAPSVASA